MARIFVSGSSDGLGLMAGRLLAGQGHRVVLHGRNPARAAAARAAVPEAAAVVEGDLETVAGMRAVAAAVNARGPLDAVIHNAAVGYGEAYRLTADGVPHVFAINTLSVYLLTALIERPTRLVYLSSALHHGADANLDDILWQRRAWNGRVAYSESKLHDAMLAFAVARRWPGVRSNALEPGWVPTRMGGPAATDDLQQAHLTQAWLAASAEPAASGSGGYFYHLKPRAANPQAHDVALQERLIGICREICDIDLPD